MIILRNIEQRSNAWFDARKGIPTGSELDKIFTSQLKQSTQWKRFMNKLEAQMFGEDEDRYDDKNMDIGRRYEDEARKKAAEYLGYPIHEVGGIFKDERRIAMISPDGINEEQKFGVEIKCTKIATHFGRIDENKVPTKYVPQILGAQWATGWDWYFVNYAPALPDDYEKDGKKKLWVLPVLYDAEKIAIVDKFLNNFYDKLTEAKMRHGVPA